MEIGSDWQEIFSKYRVPIITVLIGLTFLACGIIFWKGGLTSSTSKVEVLSSSTSSPDTSKITVEIAGQVEKPGVYKMDIDARVNDLLVIAGGLSSSADRVWTDKYLNRASKLTDGQKIYIPNTNEQKNVLSAKTNGGDQTISSPNLVNSGGLVNINTSSLKDLDSLPGIGPTYAQNIIDHRPYSTLEELVSKGAIKQSLLDKIKDKVTIY
jgi:competence protein ComEA